MSSPRSSIQSWRILGAPLLISLLLALGAKGIAQVPNPYDPSSQSANDTRQWVLQTDGSWSYMGSFTVSGVDTDGDPTDPNEAGEGDNPLTISQPYGPFAFPDENLGGAGTPGAGDPGATNSQAQDPSNDTTIGGPVSLAQGAETLSHPLLSLKGAIPLAFSLSYNSQLAGGNQYVTPSGGGSPHWTLYTPRETGHWTHPFDGQAGEFFDSNNALNLVILLYQHRRYTFIPSGGGFQTFDLDSLYDVLVKNPDGSYTLTKKDQTRYIFSGAGLWLTKIINPHGQALNINRNANGQPASVTEPISGAFLAFNYNSGGFISSVADSSGRVASLAWDGNGMLTQVLEANGATTSFTYDGNRHLLNEMDTDGNILTSNAYDANGRVYSQTDARGSNWGYNYYATQNNGLLGSETVAVDRLGKISYYFYDQNSKLLQYVNPVSGATTYTYDGNGNVLSRTDPLGNVTSYTYDGGGNVTSVTDGAGNVTSMTYDGRNNLLSQTDANGHTTVFTYDANNRLLTSKDAIGDIVTRSYDANSQLSSITQPGGGVTRFTYSKGLVSSLTNPAGGITLIGHDAAGRVQLTIDPASAATHFKYGTFGELLAVTDALGDQTAYTYDSRLRRQSKIDALGAVTTYAYDGNNNVVSVTDALGNTTSFGYDSEDRLTDTTDPLGNVSTRTYDDAGRLAQTKNGAGDTRGFTYDVSGNLVSIVDGFGQTVSTLAYDQRNLPIANTDALQRTAGISYDAAGAVSSVQDPLNRVTQFVRDATNRVLGSQNALNLAAGQTFDVDGNLMALTDPNGDSTQFAHDSSDRLTQITTARNNRSTIYYNNRNLPTYVLTPNGQYTANYYDALGRVQYYQDKVGIIGRSWDKTGRPVFTLEIKNGALQFVYRQYDAIGRLIAFWDVFKFVQKYAYDAAGNLTGITYPDGKAVSYGYDKANRLQTVTDWAGRMTTYAYDSNGQVLSVQRPDGSAETYTRDAAGQLTSVEDSITGGGEIYGANYEYDGAGQLVTEGVSPVAPSYQPAALNLTVAKDNTLAAVNNSTPSYDSNGNLIALLQPGSSNNSLLFYDVRNRLQIAYGLLYFYDADNRRVATWSKTAGLMFSVVNPNAPLDQVLEQFTANGRITRYVYGLGLIGEESAAGYKAYHYDFRGNTVALTDQNGNVTQRFGYGPFGEPAGFDPATAPTPFLYNGRFGVQTDSSGLDYMRSRYYSPALRRFLNQDVVFGSMANAATLNRFAYANGNPVSLVDPSGLAGQNLLAGFFVEGALGTVQGVYNAATNPVQTATGLYNAFANPDATIDALGSALSNYGDRVASGDARAVGQGLFQIAALLVGAGEVGAANDVAEVGVVTSGALGAAEGLAPDIAATFSGGQYTSTVLQESMIAYRYSGGVSSASGRFLTNADTVSQISSPAAASIALNLPVGATAETLNTFTIPAGTRVFTGGVAGGADSATQIFIDNPGVLIPR